MGKGVSVGMGVTVGIGISVGVGTGVSVGVGVSVGISSIVGVAPESVTGFSIVVVLFLFRTNQIMTEATRAVNKNTNMKGIKFFLFSIFGLAELL